MMTLNCLEVRLSLCGGTVMTCPVPCRSHNVSWEASCDPTQDKQLQVMDGWIDGLKCDVEM